MNYSVQTWRGKNGLWGILIRKWYMKTSKRFGNTYKHFVGWTSDEFPKYETRIDALRAGRKRIRCIVEEDSNAGQD